MSQENVEIVRRHMEAYLSGDNKTALAAYDPQVEFDASLRPEGHVYRGREGVAEAMRVWSGTWEDWNVEVEEIIDAGDHVLLIARESGRDGSHDARAGDRKELGVYRPRLSNP